MAFLVPLVLASALAQEATPPEAPLAAPEAPVEPVAATSPIVEGCATVPATPGVADAGGVPALEVTASWTEAGLEVRWLPSGVDRVRVHVQDGPTGWGRVELFCEVVDDGVFTLDRGRLAALVAAPSWSVAVVREAPSARAWTMPWTTIAGPVSAANPSPPVDRLRDLASPVRGDLTAAQVFLGVGGFGAAWGATLGLFNAGVGWQLPALGTSITAGTSLPLEGFLVGADVSLRKAHRELATLGPPPSNRRLVLGEALQYAGLGLQLVSALAVIGTDGEGPGSEAEAQAAVALAVLQTVGSGLQLGATVVYAQDVRHLKGLAPAVRPTADGATVGVRAGF